MCIFATMCKKHEYILQIYVCCVLNDPVNYEAYVAKLSNLKRSICNTSAHAELKLKQERVVGWGGSTSWTQGSTGAPSPRKRKSGYLRHTEFTGTDGRSSRGYFPGAPTMRWRTTGMWSWHASVESSRKDHRKEPLSPILKMRDQINSRRGLDRRSTTSWLVHSYSRNSVEDTLTTLRMTSQLTSSSIQKKMVFILRPLKVIKEIN